MYDDDPNTYEFNVDTQQSDSRPLGLTPIYAARTDGRVECIEHGDEMWSTSVETALPSLSHPTSMHRALYTMGKWFSHKAGEMSDEQAAELSKWCHWVRLYKESAICTTAHQKKADD